jgi:preprotein translocase subunit SecA
MAATVYIRPDVDHEDLGLHYRDACNRTGRCPGCRVDVEHWRDRAGHRHITYHHDDDCPVLTSTARPDYAAPLRVEARVGRNAPCPCGSRRKFKMCCGRAS